MAILASDIKILESERMSDETDGGGRRTSREIVDGQAGNMFLKLSRSDTTRGRVNIRKIYGSVKTANLDTYGGAHLIISKPPFNPKVHVTLFSTGSESDTRSAARDRLESYVASGPESRMILIGRQLIGQQSVVAYQRVETRLPEVGEVFCLSTEVAGVVTAQQYFRVQSVTHEIQTFTETIGSALVDFQRRVLTLGTGTPLLYEFNGPESPTQLSNVTRPTKLRTTSFVDAARYYGIRPLAAPVASGALSLRLDSIYSQLVPTATRESALANATMDSVGGLQPTANVARTETLVTSGGWANGSTRRALRAIEPGSAAIAAAGMATVTDDGAGTIDGDGFKGTVDYDTGVITRTGGSSGAASWSLTYMPAVRATQVGHTRETYITMATRGLVYTFSLLPLPAPGAVTLWFRAQKKWYRLIDDGLGNLRGDEPAYGSGIVDYTTGSVTVTLGALPDIGSSLLLAWASPAHYAIRAGATSDAGLVEQRIALGEAISPGSLEVIYTSGGVDYTATDNSSTLIAGDGMTGVVAYTAGDLLLRYTTRLPDALTSVRISFNKVSPTEPTDELVRTVTLPAAETMGLGGGAVAGTVSGSLPFGGKGLLVKDNGAGLLIVLGGQAVGAVAGLEGATVAGDQAVGTINYGTGAIAITGGVLLAGNKFTPKLVVTGIRAVSVTGGVPVFGPAPTGDGEWNPATATAQLSIGASASIGFQAAGIGASTAPVTRSATYLDAPLRLPLLASIGDNIVPGSIIFRLGGVDYIDRLGTLYAAVSALTGVGATAGTIDYATGVPALSWWPAGASPAITVAACLSAYGEAAVGEIAQRTAGAPLRPGSFYLQAVTTTGQVVTGQANSSGDISGTGVEGYVDQETGIYRVRFGELVSAAGNEGAWWFSEANVEAGQVWRPALVVPSSIRYNAVVLTSIPMNADLVGLDAVRLPSDGRVPIVRVGDLAVLHNTESVALPNPPTAGATYSVGRDDVQEIWLEDQVGVKVAGPQYSFDLEAGTVTMAAELALSSYQQPLLAISRVSDMMLVSEALIDGSISFDPAVTRDYPIEGTYLSTAIDYGDVVARVTNVRDRLTFTSWDETDGAQATAEYNVIDFPIEVLNNGAVSESWRINFLTPTTFQVIGRGLGVIATGSTSTDCQPANALTGLPYMTIRAAGWGGGWATGNQLMFETKSAAPPAWVVRTTEPGASREGDQFSLQFRGDADDE